MKEVELLIEKWKNELTELDTKFDEAFMINNMNTAYHIAGRKSQLIYCLKALKKLNVGIHSE